MRIPDVRFKAISIGKVGGFGVDADDDIHELQTGKLVQIPGKLVHVSAGDSVWGVNKDNDIFTCSGEGNYTWRHVPGKLTNVDVSDKGSVWGINREHHIFKMEGGTWKRIEGPERAVQVSVGESGVWLVQENGDIYYKTGSYGDKDCPGTDWTKVDGNLKWIASGPGIVCGVNTKYETFYRAGVTYENHTGTDWRRVNNNKGDKLDPIEIVNYDYSQVDLHESVMFGRNSNLEVSMVIRRPRNEDG